MEYLRLLFNRLTWIDHQFLIGIRDSRKAGSLWGTMRGVGDVRMSIHQSCLAKGLGLRWGYERGCDEDHWHAYTRGLPWGIPEVAGTVQVHCSRRRLLRRGLEFHVCDINTSIHMKKSLETYRIHLAYIYIYRERERERVN